MKLNIKALKKKLHDVENRVRGDHELNDGIGRHENPRKAAVMLLLVPHHTGFTVVLNKRSEALPHHPGQVSFPGGKMEKQDKNLIETALRETFEEIGIHPRQVEVVGTLDTYITRTGFDVLPVVGVVKPPVKYKINPSEVKSVFEVPLAFFANPKNLVSDQKEFKGRIYKFKSWTYKTYYIWGATANIIHNLFEHLEDECKAIQKQSKSADPHGWTPPKP